MRWLEPGHGTGGRLLHTIFRESNFYSGFHGHWTGRRCDGDRLLVQDRCRVSELLLRGPISVQHSVRASVNKGKEREKKVMAARDPDPCALRSASDGGTSSC